MAGMPCKALSIIRGLNAQLLYCHIDMMITRMDMGWRLYIALANKETLHLSSYS